MNAASTKKRNPARDALRKMLAWETKRVVMAHGRWVEAEGIAYLQRAFDWL